MSSSVPLTSRRQKDLKTSQRPPRMRRTTMIHTALVVVESGSHLTQRSSITWTVFIGSDSTARCNKCCGKPRQVRNDVGSEKLTNRRQICEICFKLLLDKIGTKHPDCNRCGYIKLSHNQILVQVETGAISAKHNTTPQLFRQIADCELFINLPTIPLTSSALFALSINSLRNSFAPSKPFTYAL